MIAALIEALYVFMATGIFAVIVVAIRGYPPARPMRAWVWVAARFGLLRDGEGYSGQSGASRVAIERVADTNPETGTGRGMKTLLRVGGDLPASVVIKSRKPSDGRTSGEPNVEIGDSSFELDVCVIAPAGVALALLDSSLRALIRDAVRQGWTLEDGSWSYAARDAGRHDAAALVRTGVALAAAVRASAATSLVPRLLERARSDPDPSVRERCLRHLAEHHPGTDALKSALNAALEDLTPSIRLLAATRLGRWDKVRPIMTDRWLDDALRVDALSSSMASPAHPDVLAAMRELSASDLPLPLRVTYAEALAVVELDDAEARLVSMLDDPEEAVRLAAMRSLAKVGTLNAVPALMQLRDRFTVRASQTVNLARNTILAIQGRAGGEAGTLALVTDGGALALAEDENA